MEAMEEKLVITCMNHGLLYSLRYKTNNNSLTCLKDLNVQQLLVDVELDQMEVCKDSCSQP